METVEASAADYRRLSLWHDTADDDWAVRPSLPGDVDADVAIVGAGYTGLWTAYYLRRLLPNLQITVIDEHVAGYGASGRNGGWCSAIFPASMTKIASISGRQAAVELQRAMNDTVAEMGDVVAREGIDCDFSHGGYVSLARNPAQLRRADAEVAGWRSWGFGDDHMRLLGPADARARLNGTPVLGGTYTPHCAAIHPAKLVRGLARVVEAAGVTIYEHTPAISIEPQRVRTPLGMVRAPIVVRATEGYTVGLEGMRRDIVPMYSLMVATEPLPPAVWDRLGLAQRETFSDKRHLRIYGQRTADGRIAFGGRGAPYHYGSAIKPEFDRSARVHALLRRVLIDMLPELHGVRFTHAWGGNLGIPRDWYPSVGFDRRTGLAAAGGYVGDGVATANLAGRVLADLIAEVDSPLIRLPIVNHRSPRWEVEPLRWLGVNAGTVLFASADRTESRTGRPSRVARGFWRLLGH